jgi:flavin-dependent dehydrogenase
VADVLIVGGGVAGSSIAIMLGRRGLAVELFEKAQFPREKPCGEGLMPEGAAVLQRLGLLECVGGCPFHGIQFHFAGQAGQICAPKQVRFRSPGFGQRRRVLDQILLSAAAATPGVQVHTGTRVDGPITENGTVVGLRVAGQELRAPLLIGADGSHSTTREKLGMKCTATNDRFGIRAHFRLPDDAVEVPWVEVFVGAEHEIYVTPLPERQIAVGILARRQGQPRPMINFLNLCRTFPVLTARLRGAEQITPVRGAFPLTLRVRRAVRRGAVLLGDAAGFVDPITGTGMSRALVTAELLADHIVRRRTCDWMWLRSFELRRRSALWGHGLLTRGLLWLYRRPHLAGRVLSIPANCSLLSEERYVDEGIC